LAKMEPETLLTERVGLFAYSVSQVPSGQKKSLICCGVIFGIVAEKPPDHCATPGRAKPGTPESLALPKRLILTSEAVCPTAVKITGDPLIEQLCPGANPAQFPLDEPGLTPSNEKTNGACGGAGSENVKKVFTGRTVTPAVNGVLLLIVIPSVSVRHPGSPSTPVPQPANTKSVAALTLPLPPPVAEASGVQ